LHRKKMAEMETLREMDEAFICLQKDETKKKRSRII